MWVESMFHDSLAKCSIIHVEISSPKGWYVTIQTHYWTLATCIMINATKVVSYNNNYNNATYYVYCEHTMKDI